MKIYEHSLKVKQNDLDALKHVNNVRYVQWVQDVAKAHWHHNASKKIKDNFYWVLLEHHIHYKSAAFLNDTLLIKTYVIEAEGVTSTRRVEMFEKTTNRLIVTSDTVWCLMDAHSLRPTRITAEIADLFN